MVFDGAGVVAAPTRGSRGVRVLFSDPGVLADDVIRALVAAEPQGRPVVVVDLGQGRGQLGVRAGRAQRALAGAPAAARAQLTRAPPGRHAAHRAGAPGIVGARL